MRMPKRLPKADQLFARNLREILEFGFDDNNQVVRPKWADGVPAHTKFILNVQETYDLAKGEFPITTLRPIAIKSAIGEILWIYRDANNNLNLLKSKYGVTWWDEWDVGDRTIGACYGEVVRRYDLFNKLLNGLKSNPFGRRHIMSLWQNKEMAEPHGLDPCCFMTTWQITDDDGRRQLHLKLEQRSSDYIMAGHINKMQYVALQMLVARELGVELGAFTHSVSNLHIYDRHIPAALELIERYEQSPKLEVLPSLQLRSGIRLDTAMPSDFTLLGYHPYPKLQSPLEIAI